ncbi:MAG TPA: HAMP domain-containing sensor histidine kinase, partial [Chitinophagaceae bacterium]|nr:HAMP domain-containing sensor histidine kinase [Chitinophagaceae bacterium]
MKTSARNATLFIFFLFLFSNGVQVYLITQRIAGTKSKFNEACTNALLTTLFEYNKSKGTGTASKPKQALIAYSLDQMAVNRLDSQNIAVSSPSSRLYAIRAEPASVEVIINRPKPVSLDLALLGSLYERALDSFKVHSKYRLDTFPIPFQTGNSRIALPERINNAWLMKRTKAYPYATNPQRIFFYPTALVFAELKYDYQFFKNDLLWPMLAFSFILLISNTALVFVYKTIRRQKRINEVKTDFINNMTHEMKTPITIASAGLEALEHHISPTERTGFYLHTSKRQLRLLDDFVERILDAAVQDIPDFGLKKEKIDLHTLFDELTQSHSVLNKKKVSFRLAGQWPAFILGDRLHLETAFHNIIDNAIKYSKGSVEIDIDIAENNYDCTIKIRDNGMGIPPQYIKNIFEKFFRVPQGDAQSIKGFGLGLYYVSNIVKKHSGNITVHSKLQSGTEFIITL